MTPTWSAPGPAPTSRRALREAEQRRRRLPTPAQMVRAVPWTRQAAALAVGFALAGGVTSWSRAAVDPAPPVVLGGAPDRSHAAASARLTAQGQHFADQVRAEAVDTAQMALTRLEAVQSVARTVPLAADLTELEARSTELNALLAEAGVSPGGAEAEPTAAIAVEAESTEPDVVPEPKAAGPEPTVPEPTVPEPTVPELTVPEPTAPPTTAPVEAAASVAVAPLDVSLRILAVVENLTGLTDAVQAEIDAQVAAAQALADYIADVESHDNGAIPTDLLCAPSFAPDYLLRCDAVDALEELNVAYAEEFGEDLPVVSAYRDYATQVATRYRRGGLAARPGTSNHGLGLAVDLGGFGRVGQFGSTYYRWMAEHAEAYGWFHPEHMGPNGSGPREPWHWEFDPALVLGEESTPLPGVD